MSNGQSRYKSNLRRKRRLKKRSVPRPVRTFSLAGSSFRYPDPAIQFSDVGTREANCYANHLGDCSGGISGEHFLSKSVLEQFGSVIPSKGIPWIRGVERNIGINSLVTNCLCRRHNSALSSLDSFGGAVFEHLSSFNMRSNGRLEIDGNLLEFWMLKVLLSAVCTGQFSDGEKRFGQSDISSDLVDTLFRGKPLAADLGIYIRPNLGDRLEFSKSVSMAPVFLEEALAGISMKVSGLEFLLSLRPKDENFNRSSPEFERLMRHPKHINYEKGLGGIDFIWQN